jgi:uncharacterized RmlC-like cupin family protein
MSTSTPQTPEYTAPRRIRPEGPPGAARPGGAPGGAISGRTVGAQRLWLGKMASPPGRLSGVHHHGAGETAVYVLRGRITLFFGEGLRQRLDLQAGDFAFVPAWAIHAEGNLSTEAAEVLLARSAPEALTVDLPALRVPEEVLRGGAERGTPGTDSR